MTPLEAVATLYMIQQCIKNEVSAFTSPISEARSYHRLNMSYSVIRYTLT